MKMSAPHVGPTPGTRKKTMSPKQTRICLGTALCELTAEPLAIWEVEETGMCHAGPIDEWASNICQTPYVQAEFWMDKPGAGEVWRDSSGKMVTVVANAHHAYDGDHLVIYKAADGVL